MYFLKKHIISIFIILLLSTACASYYKKMIQYQGYITSGEFEKANKWLNDKEKKIKEKDRVLYYLDKGYVERMVDNYAESNHYFQKADYYIEDFMKQPAREALSLVTNPMVKPYEPEDFEKVMLHYYTSLNYLDLDNRDGALVEARRINIKLNALNDKYKDHKNKYQRDAFAHVMMGLIYDAAADYNNAFIAYRNAYNIYREDYTRSFGIGPPEILEKDLIRTAYMTGFFEEARQYEKETGFKFKNKKNDAELVFFWLNGLGPVKEEWSVNFTTVKGKGGWINLVNKEYNLSFPFYTGDLSREEKKAFENFRIFRVAFPRYAERKPVFADARFYVGKKSYSLEIAQDINQIAHKTLRDRMIREMANSLLRLATKKALEAAASKENEGLGALVSITNAVTEKADTRNWQALPYAIHYTRIPLFEGENKLILSVRDPNGRQKQQEFMFQAKKGKTYFHSYHSLESYPPR